MDFEKMVNDFCREFRKTRDRLADKSAEFVEKEAKTVIKDFWKEQDWFTRTFVKPYVMKILYRLVKKI